MQQEVLLAALVERVDGLRIGGGAQRRIDQRLGLTAREERDAVSAR
jgi:hypothetical protein